MKQKLKEHKGITLVALIITIIVLLILAVVAISVVNGNGILNHAQNSKIEYSQAQTNEQDILDYYESYLSGTVGAWKQEGATLTKINSDGTKTQVKIGDYVNYNEGSYKHTPKTEKGAGTSRTGGSGTTGHTLGTTELTTENLKWRVLGVNEKGELELISADPTTQSLYLANDVGYVNAEENLNDFCNDLYGQGTNSEGEKVATGARSLKVEDIDNLTKYDKTTYSGYGNKWTYKYPTDDEVSAPPVTGLTKNMWYRTDKADGILVKDWTNITSSSYQKFRLPEETTAISSSNRGSKELTYTYYSYNIANNLTTEDGYTSEEATAISNMITKGTTSSDISQWLASRCVSCKSSYASFFVRYVNRGYVDFNILFNSYGSFYCSHCRVRPVVSLAFGISLTGTGDNIGSASNEWQLAK